MNKFNISESISQAKKSLVKHSPEILTGLGITSMITSTVLAVKATPKALMLLEEAQNKNGGEQLTTVETIKVAWRPYIPSMIFGVMGVACVISGSTVSAKRNAALATAYALSERTLLTYRDKVIETIGEKKEKDIREKISQDGIDNNPVSKSQVIVTSKGNTLCMDSITGRYFRSDLDTIRKSVNELNRKMTYDNYISLNEFYHCIGLAPIKNGYQLGWNLDRGLIDIDFNTCLADDEPCVVIDYSVAPDYNFDRFF